MVKIEVILLGTLFVVGICAVPQGRIVGGSTAAEGQFPHQVSLRRYGSHVCGGSVISATFILTAAHCVSYKKKDVYYNYEAGAISIRAGSNERYNDGIVVQAREVITHENYSGFINDIALVRLAQQLIYSKTIKPITLADTEVSSGERVTISGWGRLQAGGDSPTKLQWTILTAITTSECQTSIGMGHDALICLSHDHNMGACNGDSGGPAVYGDRLVGIAGFVVGYCGSENPDGYTKVAYHIKWIRQHANLFMSKAVVS